MSSKILGTLKGLALVAGAFLSISSANAGMTSIGKMGAGEDSQMQIFDHAYGGSWHKVGTDFYNGGMSAKRMDDFLSDPSVLDIARGDCGMSTDQKWCGNKFTVSAIAKFSGNSQNLGIVDSHGTHNVFGVTGYGYNIAPESQTIDLNGQTFEWQRSGDSGTDDSLDSHNTDLRDHLITYVVNGLPGQSSPVWMLFFEDMIKTSTTPKNRTFADFNDLVVEVRPVVNPIPLPPASWAGLVTLAGGALVKSRKFIFRAVTA
jgi:hypothetical protein